jgi:hypothetical protein
MARDSGLPMAIIRFRTLQAMLGFSMSSGLGIYDSRIASAPKIAPYPI